MKFLSVFILIAVALLAQESEAFWRGGFGRFGMGGFGPFGMGGFGGFGANALTGKVNVKDIASGAKLALKW